MMVQPVCLMPAILMRILPVRAQFHLSAHVTHAVVVVSAMLPSLVCTTPVPFIVSPSTHPTPSLSSFVQFSCRDVAYFHVLP